MELREVIQMLADKGQEIYSQAAEVIAVDTAARTIDVTPLNGDPDVFAVRMQATPSLAAGVVMVPALNSAVVITWLSKTRAYLALCSEVDEIIISGGTSTIDLDQLDFNGGANGGLINITPLVNKINTLESDLNTIKAIFTGWVPVPNDGGAVLKTATATWAGQTLTPTTTADIEDELIKH